MTRKIRPNPRSVTGLVSTRNGTAVPVESTLERDFVVWCDFYCALRKIQAQPLTVHFKDGTQSRKYTPDFYVEYEDDRKVVYEIKYRDELRDRWGEFKPGFRAMRRHCRERSWGFKIVTDVELRSEAYLKNAYFLRGFLRSGRSEPMEAKLIETLRLLGESTPRELLGASFCSMDWRLQAIPSVWRLIAAGDIGTLLAEPLTMKSAIWANVKSPSA